MQYDAIVRIFVLPKSHAPHTLVVISLDPPIRKGQTHYPHILVQFPSDEEISAELEISDELFEAKNQAVSPHAGPCPHFGLDPILPVKWHESPASTSTWDTNPEPDCCAVRWKAEQAAGGAGLRCIRKDPEGSGQQQDHKARAVQDRGWFRVCREVLAEGDALTSPLLQAAAHLNSLGCRFCLHAG